MFQVTDSASEQLQKIMAAPESKGKNLVLFFQGVGCAGPSVGMTLHASTGELQKIESNGVEAYMDPKALEYINKQFGDINVDFVTRDEGSGHMVTVGDGSAGECGSGCSCG